MSPAPIPLCSVLRPAALPDLAAAGAVLGGSAAASV